MDMNNFNYNFYDTLEKLTKTIQENFKSNVDEFISQNPNISERDLILKIVDMRYVDSLNICTSVLLDYHKALKSYLSQLP